MRFGAFLLAARFPGHSHATVLASTVAAAVAAGTTGFDDVSVAVTIVGLTCPVDERPLGQFA
jgi:hypothetical protein